VSDAYDPRVSLLKGIEEALRSNAGGVRNAHPWIVPLWTALNDTRSLIEQLELEIEGFKTQIEELKKPKVGRPKKKTDAKQNDSRVLET
tara:strand:+ start:215 stop:481 length:267 start_codon:yes stop_codon:yes gene_type:complete